MQLWLIQKLDTKIEKHLVHSIWLVFKIKYINTCLIRNHSTNNNSKLINQDKSQWNASAYY